MSSFRVGVANLVLSLVFAGSALGGTVTLQPKMGDPLAGLTAGQLARFDAGKVAFAHVFQASEGLGPIFNKDSCGSCHSAPLGGSSSIFVTRFGRLSKDGFDPLADLGGSLLQALAISPTCQETIPGLSNIQAHRVTPSTLGFGLVEAVADADIRFLETNPPSPVTGRVHEVEALEDPGPTRVGRFGWKCQVATVLTFSGDASLNEMGITNALVMVENAPNGDEILLAQCDTVAEPEDVPDGMGVTFIEKATDFQRFLSPPPQTPRSGMTGETLFDQIGCTKCHKPTFTTMNSMTLEDAIRNKPVKAYSDFLLHDVGQNADFIPQGDASEREIRTTPLWGLRIRDPMWHDGRVAAGTFADRIAGPTGAVKLHKSLLSESGFAVDNWDALTQPQRDQIVAFLDSLGRREFDHDGDNVIGPSDLRSFINCYNGPGNYTADSPCAISDVDQDGDVDDDDYALFLTVYQGPVGDCNNNTTPDPTDILNGTSSDCNNDGVPDECQPPFTDVAAFVAAALSAAPTPMELCLFDLNNDTFINGRDVQAYVNKRLGL